MSNDKLQHTYILGRKRGKQNTHGHIIMPPYLYMFE